MQIAFLDPTPLDYTVETPHHAPLGGTQSAACYLAAELAALGHKVAIVNSTSTPGEYRGVTCLHHERWLSASFLNDFDIAIVLSSASAGFLRQIGVCIPLVLWNQHSHDQDPVQQLLQTEERAMWAGFAFVSQWQLDNFVTQCGVPRDKSRVLRNAMSPAFAVLAPAPPWFNCGAPPVLVYTSTPFRGLDVLLVAFPKIRSAIPDVRLRVFSSMAMYQVKPQNDKFRNFYAYCATMDGVDYVGPVGQDQLAQELSGAAALAYPSTFAETSCIAAIEAMAAGAAIFTTRLGALPETTAGFADVIEVGIDRRQLAENYADMVICGLDNMSRDPLTAASRRDTRIAFAMERYVWPGRAAEWIVWLSTILDDHA